MRLEICGRGSRQSVEEKEKREEEELGLKEKKSEKSHQANHIPPNRQPSAIFSPKTSRSTQNYMAPTRN